MMVTVVFAMFYDVVHQTKALVGRIVKLCFFFSTDFKSCFYRKTCCAKVFCMASLPPQHGTNICRMEWPPNVTLFSS